MPPSAARSHLPRTRYRLRSGNNQAYYLYLLAAEGPRAGRVRPRSRTKPEMLQGALFSYLEAP
jgi:hypothetical protein